MKMAGMRPLTSDNRLQALSVPEITEAFEDAAVAISRVHEFNGRKLKPGPLLNAIVLRFLEMDEGERGAFAGESLARLELLLAENDKERERASNRLTPARGKPAWRPGAVRDQSSIDKARPRDRKRAEDKPPPEVNETRVLPEQPRKRKRPEAG
jgi:hypothetical protein